MGDKNDAGYFFIIPKKVRLLFVKPADTVAAGTFYDDEGVLVTDNASKIITE